MCKAGSKEIKKTARRVRKIQQSDTRLAQQHSGDGRAEPETGLFE
jgi:hypothetical protein